MAYNKTIWHNDQAPAINETNLNKIEEQLAQDSARIDEIVTLPPGSTQGNAELVDIRVGAGGETYPNAGTAVREQIGAIKEDLSQVSESIGEIPSNVNKFKAPKDVKGGVSANVTFTPIFRNNEFYGINANGTASSNTVYEIPFHAKGRLYLFTENTSPTTFIYVQENDGSGSWRTVSNSQNTTKEPNVYTYDEGKAYRMRFRVQSGVSVANLMFTPMLSENAMQIYTPHHSISVEESINQLDIGISSIREGLHPTVITNEAVHSIVREGFRYQAITYDSINHKYVIVGNNVNKNGQAKLTIASDIVNFSDAFETIIESGHSNDITFNHNTGYCYICASWDSNSEIEGELPPNTITVVDPTNGTVVDRLQVNQLADVSAIEYIDGYYYMTDNSLHVHKFTEDFDYIGEYNSTTTKENLLKLLNDSYSESTNDILTQGLVTINNTLYRIFAYSHNTYGVDSCALLIVKSDNSIPNEVIIYRVARGDEVEGVVAVGNCLATVTDGRRLTIYRANLSAGGYNPYTYSRLSEGIDLNDIHACGKYTASDAISLTIIHAPENIRGFTLYVEGQGNDLRRQYYVSNPMNGNEEICNIYTRGWTANGWGSWFKFNLTKI